MKTGPNVTRGIPASTNKIHHHKSIAICTMISLGKGSLALLNTFKTLVKVVGISLDNMTRDDMSKFELLAQLNSLNVVSKGDQIKKKSF